MSETMKAVVAHGRGDYRLEELNVPTLKNGEMLIRVEGCGICAAI